MSSTVISASAGLAAGAGFAGSTGLAGSGAGSGGGASSPAGFVVPGSGAGGTTPSESWAASSCAIMESIPPPAGAELPAAGAVNGSIVMGSGIIYFVRVGGRLSKLVSWRFGIGLGICSSSLNRTIVRMNAFTS